MYARMMQLKSLNSQKNVYKYFFMHAENHDKFPITQRKKNRYEDNDMDRKSERERKEKSTHNAYQ